MSGADRALRALLRRAPVIPVFTPGAVDEAVDVARALLRGGLPVIEVTLRTPAAVAAIAAMAQALPEAAIGAGTVLDAEQLQAVRRAGASFAVSPGATPRLYDAARDCGMPVLPGIATASELMAGLERGLDTFKFFPAAAAGGPALLSAWAGPFPQVRFCPTGGITAASAADYLRLRNVLCIGSSWLTPRTLVEARDWEGIEVLARTAARLRPQEEAPVADRPAR
ncbi:bifunctional 4-hydroxy-2-oxoglutarate aldolase/2-dehydro-3-deoxy-phosphogluconate aldolase [Stenotrophomonas sp. MMGLT7]|uniref:bifunctional 4-hydroxy-2-oxoglutarate aldolase/2-dehydro-3-deoxy-phosphogluconate aldolase n=1 Tax=Stenotrophomonas sp. MMGLT7 TaxID=2901227 RepID=UPI001E65BB80|nr:bifunctional 4-hydroxy-2-oxoglutarate aldolase/2-dehydro-3-deoxy-phosphogluconate aldolase [Stenotrophomonas sp. MMGLT7]MCD7098541.1 bifunctional 4-hydroxy-2-oxoglutarate aldolase/2-dehydro-3-deoxy-phosphogluconate aldolase [Stenotrophomonas sp. MMGLT7]